MKPVVLTDIEGTTSSISFVRDVLFPYARRELPRFVREHGRDPEVRRWLDAVAAENGGICSDDVIVETLQGWIDEDRKHTALKALQGMVWAEGYRAGQLKGHVYPDAVEALRRWHEQGLALFVYSSGSIQAQKLIFGCAEVGDLTPLFSGYFDTGSGPKREVASYMRISESIGIPPGEMLFLSDVVEELDAAREAGMRTCGLGRNGEVLPGHRTVADFSAIDPAVA